MSESVENTSNELPHKKDDKNDNNENIINQNNTEKENENNHSVEEKVEVLTNPIEGDEVNIETGDEGEVDMEEYFLVSSKEKMIQKKEFNKKLVKFILMIILVFGFFIAELIGGLLGNSLSLLSDSFHMLGDSLSLFVGLGALLLTRRKRSKIFSFGWGRSEILGGLINSVFLLSVVFFIFVEGVHRFLESEPIQNPWLVLIVGGIGLVINVIGLCLFHEHGHDHSHGGKKKEERTHEHNELCKENCKEHEKDVGKKKQKSENMMGVFLHLFGDFLGSIMVMISCGLYLFFTPVFENEKCTQNCIILYVDPICSLILATVILISTLPLFLRTSKILMQTVPNNIDLDEIKNKILYIEGVQGVHDFHIWKLVNETLVCSVHIIIYQEDSIKFMKIARKVQCILHEFDVHSSTIQPEFINEYTDKDKKKKRKLDCSLACIETKCIPKTCCPYE